MNSRLNAALLRHSLIRPLLSADVLAPISVGILMLGAWELGVRISGIPPYLLPGPLLVLQTLVKDWSELFPSLLITLKITVVAFIAAVVSGLLVAILFAQSKWIERSFFSLCGDIANHAYCGDRPSDHYLGSSGCPWRRFYVRFSGHLRLDCRVLSYFIKYDFRLKQRRSSSAQSISIVSVFPLANSDLSSLA